MMNIFDEVLGMEQGHVVSMLVGPSVNPYFDDFTIRLQLYRDHTGVALERVWQCLELGIISVVRYLL